MLQIDVDDSIQFFQIQLFNVSKKTFHPENYMPKEIDLKHQNNALPLKFTVDCTVAPSGGSKVAY